MKLQAMIVGLGLLHSAVSFDSHESPDCLSKCWNNSKYVSTCLEATGTQCFCEDGDFQNVVLQCLYSQCQNTQFGSALHYALLECSDPETETRNFLPPLIRHQGLRKRGSQPSASVPAPDHVRLVSESAKLAVYSVVRHSALASGFAKFSARPIRSVALPPTATLTRTALPFNPLLTFPTSAISPSTSVQGPTTTS